MSDRSPYSILRDVADSLSGIAPHVAVLADVSPEHATVVFDENYDDVSIADLATIFVKTASINHGAVLQPVISETADYMDDNTALTFRVVGALETAGSDELFLEQAAIDSDDDDYLDEDEEIETEDDDDEDDGDDDEGSSGGAQRRSEKPGSLKVLTSADHHKMASKLFAQLGEGANLAQYPQFLIDFDKFLQTYGGLTGAASRSNKSSDEEASFDNILELASEEVAGKKKKGFKKGRSGLLSALMKLMSGDTGDSILKAWDAQDSDKLTKLMGEAIDKMASQLRSVQENAEDEGRVPAKDGNVGERKIWYARRDVLNGKEILDWIAANTGITRSLPENKLHTTIVFSPTQFDADQFADKRSNSLEYRTKAKFEQLGPNKALVLVLDQGSEMFKALLDDFNEATGMGASSDFPDYKAHVTISYWDDKIEMDKLPEFEGTLKLGPVKVSVFNAPEKGGIDPTKYDSISLTDRKTSDDA